MHQLSTSLSRKKPFSKILRFLWIANVSKIGIKRGGWKHTLKRGGELEGMGEKGGVEEGGDKRRGDKETRGGERRGDEKMWGGRRREDLVNEVADHYFSQRAPWVHRNLWCWGSDVHNESKCQTSVNKVVLSICRWWRSLLVVEVLSKVMAVLLLMSGPDKGDTLSVYSAGILSGFLRLSRYLQEQNAVNAFPSQLRALL